MSGYDTSIFDTGPALNFFAARKHELLLDVLDAISVRILVPEDVVEEFNHKAKEDDRFRNVTAAFEWACNSGRVTVISSDAEIGSPLHRNLRNVLGPAHERKSHRQKDFGEKVVIGHAMTFLQEGEQVVVLIDDGGGQDLAARKNVDWIDTFRILQIAHSLGKIPTWANMRELYVKLEPFDDGLPSVGSPHVTRELRALYR